MKPKLRKLKPVVAKNPINEARLRTTPLPIRLSEDDDGIKVPKEVQLFKTGTFKKLQPNGKTIEIEITREVLSEMIQNWKDHVRGVDLAIDFAHNSDDEAAAWIKNLTLKEAGDEAQLWAEVDWTPDGHAAVAGKKFRYLSPDFQFSYTDNQSGKKYGATLFGAGLTNRPVIKNMAPAVELTEVEEMAKTKIKKISELSAEELKVKLAEETDAEKKELIQLRLDEMSDEGGDDEEEEKETKLPVGSMSFEELSSKYTKVCEELSDLKKSQATLMAEGKKKEKSNTFDKMLTAGKVVEAQRDAFMKDDTIKFAELAQPTKFGAIGNDGKAIEQETEAQDEILKLADEAVKAGKVDKANSIHFVLAENPKLNEKYQKELSGDAA